MGSEQSGRKLIVRAIWMHLCVACVIVGIQLALLYLLNNNSYRIIDFGKTEVAICVAVILITVIQVGYYVFRLLNDLHSHKETETEIAAREQAAQYEIQRKAKEAELELLKLEQQVAMIKAARTELEQLECIRAEVAKLERLKLEQQTSLVVQAQAAKPQPVENDPVNEMPVC